MRASRPAGCRTFAAALAALIIAAGTAHAGERSAVDEVFRQVVFDPTTYAPAAISYTAERLDWKSSQVFFQHGYLEANAQFTRTGRPNDVPVGYAAGKRLILGNALHDLGASVLNNVVERIVERWLMVRHPRRQKLIRTLGWVQRISFAAGLGTVQSARHFRQWRENERVARELGYK
jgi:hypothetical protein